MNAPVNVPTTVQLVDHSPPNGDYARYIEQLMQRSEAAAAAQVAQAGEHGRFRLSRRLIPYPAGVKVHRI
ncbi:hypothetical protein [Ottowia sp. VDI28]|uniref:hypothetical protein n=1 Tax=Ottowia sp. VDI28 TaxID=3133968 RepID=UPI003C2CB69C